ncbi:hypothetical protein FOZ62_020437 [Perkinsus olseni]|uniref:FHA domain-containing protein n=3 Tax=Perkinsus olseni TaxID=32597 RepID=A0A7J6SNL9_PEROL|nr:hypothetical protein FOZ62_020437 [Perkinsus olseni]
MDCSDEHDDLDDTVVMESENEADENVEHSNIVDIIRSSSSAGRGAEVATSVAKRRRGSRGKVFRQRDEAAPFTHSDGPVIACTQVQAEDSSTMADDRTAGAGGAAAPAGHTAVRSPSESTKSHTRSIRGRHRRHHGEDHDAGPRFVPRCVGDRVRLSGSPPTTAMRTTGGISGGTLVVEVPDSHDQMGWAFTIKVESMASGIGNTMAVGILPDVPQRWDKTLYSRPENLVNPVLIGYDLPKVKIGKDVSMHKLDSRLWRPRTMLKEGSKLTLRAWQGGAGGQWWVLMVESEGQRRISPYITSIRVSEHPHPYGLVDLSGNVRGVSLVPHSPPAAQEAPKIRQVPDLCPPLEAATEGVFAQGFLSPSLRLSPDMRTAVRYEGLKQAVTFVRTPLPTRNTPTRIAVRVLSAIKCGPKSCMALGLCSSKSLPKRRVDMTYIDNASDLRGPAFVCGYELPVVYDIPGQFEGEPPSEKIPASLLRPVSLFLVVPFARLRCFQRKFVSGDVFKLSVCIEPGTEGGERWMARAWQNDNEIAVSRELSPHLVEVWKEENTMVAIVDVAGSVNAVRLVDTDDTEFPCPKDCVFHLYGLSSNVRTPSHRDDTSFIHPGPVDGSYRIGRHRNCNLCIDSAYKSELVSRNHCSLSIEGNHLIATDGGGINGTFVNHKRLPSKSSQTLLQGCTLGLGDRINGLEFLVRLSPELSTSDNQADGKLTKTGA